MRFVHAADLHVDSPLRGLERYEGAPVSRIRAATRRAVENLVDLCLEEEASFLLLAGDLYDGDWPDYSTGLFFARQMSRLREAGVRVFLVRGNHDAHNRILRGLTLPENVTELDTRQPQTVVDEDRGVAVHGQGFARAAITEDLAAGYPPPLPGYLNVGLLHTCLDGREGHDPYAPCSAVMLAEKGYDYWALGHVHAREEVRRDPWIVFPGNLQGRHARETGPKGATLVTVEDGRVVSVEHRPCDVVRWERLEVDVSEAASGHDVVELVRVALERTVTAAEDRLVAARVALHGRCRAHATLVDDPARWESEIRALASDIGADAVWLEKLRFSTNARVDPRDLEARDDALGQLARSLRTLGEDDERLSALCVTELGDLEQRLPQAAKIGPDGIRLDDLALLREALRDVEQLLLSRALADGGDR